MSIVENSQIRSHQWIASLSIVALSIVLVLYGAFISSPSKSIPYALGVYLLPAFVLALVFWNMVNIAREHKGTVFIVILASLVVGNFLGTSRERHEALKVLRGIQETTNSYVNQALTDPLTKPRQIEVKEASTETQGDLGLVEMITKQTMNDFVAARNSYLSDLEAAGWFALLDVGRLQADQSFIESKKILEQGEAIVLKYQHKSLEMLSGMRTRVEQAPFRSESIRTSMLTGMQSSLPRTKENTQRLWDMERASIEEMSALIHLLEEKRGNYQFANSQVQFRDQVDLAAWSKHIQAIQKLAKQQHELQRQMQEDSARKLERARQ